jgi:hypothetical protein
MSGVERLNEIEDRNNDFDEASDDESEDEYHEDDLPDLVLNAHQQSSR